MAEANPKHLTGKLPDLLIEEDRGEGHSFCFKSLERSKSEAALLQGKRSQHHSSLSSQDSTDPGDLHNISECSKVYFDLSKGETFEEHTGKNVFFAPSRSNSGRFLETIHQNEELRVDEMTLNYRDHRSISVGSTSSMDSMDGRFFRADTDGSQDGANFLSTFEALSVSLKDKITKIITCEEEAEQIEVLNDINILIDQAWSTPTIGRDLAYGLSAIINQEKALDAILRYCLQGSKSLLVSSIKVLEQVLTTDNREYVAANGLDPLVQMCLKYKDDREIAQMTTGILESMFKTSEDTCQRLIDLGGLEVILYWCRGQDRLTLRHCAIALANLSLYGGPENHSQMIHLKVPEWLFPLAFNEDDIVRYYACLAISVLVANKLDKKIETAVLNSGTLALVLPFITSHTPMEFAQMDLWHRHGRSHEWLQRLVSVLTSKRQEPQALAAFHFAMEAGIKSEQGRKKIFTEIDAIEPLKKVASTSPNPTASRLAADALKILGEEIPHRLSQNVQLWSNEDVIFWVSQIGYCDYIPQFKKCDIDGDLLLRITEDDLIDSINMNLSLARKRFMRELRDLKISSEYTSCDPTKLDDWLKQLSPELGQYTYQLLLAGVDRNFLCQMSEDHLREDCGVTNGVHRAKILQQIREQVMHRMCSKSSVDVTDAPDTYTGDKTIDAFISYRRLNGAQLASLLKVHLQLRGFSVFLDIERLNAGKFDEGLLTSIAQSKNFILVLTADALERCKNDIQKKDWVHREIVAALESKCNIIPITDNFEWPSGDTLPEDMKQICFFNGIKWIHDYQDACVEKLERFLRGEKKPSLHGLGSSFEDNPPHGQPHGYDPVVRPKRGQMQGMGASFEDCL
ncbi:NAD(+) hydrolase SARM1-like [Mercenaria mercenaria]|uniref:NAD(+) hydrolase SARM1-like n=1 Tax=Mercenaria mercenaria TaxID=6596 RepID=UPI00234F7296|nr:NAD(+) hydrolase SARM1-like [Mercenaria mercenaria]XP_045171329.2 NAD(+) hydrolase SARM1-like [Mercenaria mercenaria]XP_045171330.2 NAD(+) hydrolase SARM1-like [Mercenaria mercenaria]XP_053375715.1 NAD(+) hydrolase SARM1-like [Mercenaria mercenaria]